MIRKIAQYVFVCVFCIAISELCLPYLYSLFSHNLQSYDFDVTKNSEGKKDSFDKDSTKSANIAALSLLKNEFYVIFHAISIISYKFPPIYIQDNALLI